MIGMLTQELGRGWIYAAVLVTEACSTEAALAVMLSDLALATAVS